MQENIFARVRGAVLDALRRTVPDLPDEVASRVEVTPTRDPAHGDMATNAAMVSAKAARQPPAKIAAGLVAKLQAVPDIAAAEAAGPGFVNPPPRPAPFPPRPPPTPQAEGTYRD